MTRLSICSLALVMTAGSWSLGAQAPMPEATKTSAPMTVSGCLRSSSAAGTASGTQTVTYTLDVAGAADPKGSAAPMGGADAKGKAPMTNATYAISAEPAVGLAKHVNHRVELTGMMKDMTMPSTGDTRKQPSAESPGAIDASAAASNRAFQATAIKMISADCPQQ